MRIRRLVLPVLSMVALAACGGGSDQAAGGGSGEAAMRFGVGPYG